MRHWGCSLQGRRLRSRSVTCTHLQWKTLPRERLRIHLERFLVLRRVPFVAALEALPEIAARFRELHLRAHVAAFRTRLRYRLVPRHEIAIVVRARIEGGAALARPA